MTLRTAIVISLTCDHQAHPDHIPVTSTYSGLTPIAAEHAAKAAGWRFISIEEQGRTIVQHHCLRCVTRDSKATTSAR